MQCAVLSKTPHRKSLSKWFMPHIFNVTDYCIEEAASVEEKSWRSFSVTVMESFCICYNFILSAENSETQRCWLLRNAESVLCGFGESLGLCGSCSFLRSELWLWAYLFTVSNNVAHFLIACLCPHLGCIVLKNWKKRGNILNLWVGPGGWVQQSFAARCMC